MQFFLLLFSQPPLLTSDFLTNHDMTRSKKVTFSGGNKLAVLVGLILVALRVITFEVS